MSSKTNNLANTHPIKPSVRTHTALRRALVPPSPTEQSGSVSGSGVLDCTTLPIVVSLDPRALSSTLEWAHLSQWLRGRDCLSPRPDRDWLCSWGPLMVMSFLGARNQERPLESRLLSTYATPQVAEETQGRGYEKREFWSRKSKRYHMSGIRKWLHNASSPFFLFSRSFSSLLLKQAAVTPVLLLE